MSSPDRDMKSLAKSAGIPVASSGPSTNSRRVSDIIDLTLSDDDENPNDEESDHGLDNDDSEDDSDNGSDKIMLDNPPPIYNAPPNIDYQPDPILPRGINWPFILKIGKETPKCLIPRQFITPANFGRCLDLLNPHLSLTTPQYAAAWVYAVNQCRDKVDLTATFAANPGLDQLSFANLINDEFEKILVNDWGVDLQTRAKEITAIRSEIPHSTGKELKKLRREEKKLTNPRVRTRLTKNERKALKAAAESQSRILGRGPQHQYISSVVYQHREKKPHRRGEVKQADGTRSTAANTVPLSRNLMAESNAGNHPSLSTARPDQKMGDQAPAPALIPASSWYFPSESQVSWNVNAGFSSNADFTPFKPYTPTRFSREDIWHSHPMSDSTHSQYDSYRPHSASFRPEPRYESYRPQYTPHRPRSPHSHSLPPRPEPRPGHVRSIAYASSLTPTPVSLPPRLPPTYTFSTSPAFPGQRMVKMSELRGTMAPGTDFLEHAERTLAERSRTAANIAANSANAATAGGVKGIENKRSGVRLEDGGVRLSSGVRSRWDEERA